MKTKKRNVNFASFDDLKKTSIRQNKKLSIHDKMTDDEYDMNYYSENDYNEYDYNNYNDENEDYY